MGQLADLAEEEGHHHESRAWQWMLQHNKYPGVRRVGRKTKWGWQLTGEEFLLFAEDQQNAPEVIGGPTVLPRLLYDHGHIGTGNYLTAEDALNAGVKALAEMFRLRGKRPRSEGELQEFQCPHCHEDTWPVRRGKRYFCSECGGYIVRSLIMKP